MIFILFAIVFSNARLAMRRGKSSWGWGLLTFLGFLLAESVGVAFILMTSDHPALVTIDDSRRFADLIQNDVLKNITVGVFGLGGGLLVRYILQRSVTPTLPEGPQEDSGG